MRKVIVSIIMTVLLGIVQTADATSIGFSPNPNITVTTGGTYSIDVILSGLPTGQIVSAFDLDVLYDPSLLNVSSVTFGSLLGNVGSFEVLQSSILRSGVIDFAAVSLLSDSDLQALQSSAGGSITLATLNFGGLATGSTSLAFDWYAGQDVKGMNDQIIAGYVPEPGTFLLMGSGFLSLLGLRRKSSLLARFRR